MPYHFPFSSLALRELLEAYLPDFALAFTFFTALIFAVLERRLGSKRPVIAMSAALGLTLSISLVWWEHQTGWTIRDLGPVAAGFALILLAGVLHQAIRYVGGNWAGAATAFGACILVGTLLGIDWPIDSEVLHTVVTVALVFGLIAFMFHQRGTGRNPRYAHLAGVRNDMSDLYQDGRIAKKLTRGFRRVRNEAATLFDRPDGADDVMLQLRRMLPAEGWLTEQMASLRARAHHIRKGHVARIEGIQHVIGKLPPLEKRKLAIELQSRYKELKLDLRIERLDKAVTENERRIRELTRHAQAYLKANEHRRLVGVLEAAGKLQKHNAKLIRTIERTETRLLATAVEVAKNTPEVQRV